MHLTKNAKNWGSRKFEPYSRRHIRAPAQRRECSDVVLEVGLETRPHFARAKRAGKTVDPTVRGTVGSVERRALQQAS